MNAETINDIDTYISTFPESTQGLLRKMRATIRKAAPEAEEAMAYGIPTFKLHGNLVHFAGFKNHIGFYPAPSGIEAFKKELAVYHTGKGTLQFPLDKPLPLKLVSDIVKYRVKSVKEKVKAKTLRTCPKGHKYYKTTDCPTCPVCEQERKPKAGFLPSLAAPAIRALENKGIKTLKQLAGYTEAEILALHGMGSASIPKLKAALSAQKLNFKRH